MQQIILSTGKGNVAYEGNVYKVVCKTEGRCSNELRCEMGWLESGFARGSSISMLSVDNDDGDDHSTRTANNCLERASSSHVVPLRLRRCVLRWVWPGIGALL